MCWKNKSETKVSYALKNRAVKTYDVETGDVDDELECSGGEGKLTGLEVYDNHYISCVESGALRVWDESGAVKTEIEAGENVCKLVQNRWKPNLVATGGKENDLKVWDLSNPTDVLFKAKNVKHDWLNLRVPVWILDMSFLPDSQKVVMATGHHQVRVYDPSAQRRPVLSMEFDEYPLTAMGLVANEYQVVVGNTHGKMGLLDFRKGKLLHCFKGFAGGIRSIECHPTLPLIASCGLDRFLRIHDLNTKKLLHKFYLKSRLNCLLMKSDGWETVPGGEEITETAEDAEEGMEDGEGGEKDDLWDNLDEVRDRKRKHQDEKLGKSAKISREKMPDGKITVKGDKRKREKRKKKAKD
ncbi:WD repeat-containing protein 74-like isoform X2 [Lineus longissimus]